MRRVLYRCAITEATGSVPGVAANDAKKLLPGSVGQISRRHGAGADDGRNVAARRRRRRQRLGAPNPVRLYRKERNIQSVE